MGGTTDLVIEGQDRLLEKPEFHEAGHVRRLVTALDAREKLIKLLDRAMQAQGGRVAVGEEVEGLGGRRARDRGRALRRARAERWGRSASSDRHGWTTPGWCPW